MKYYKRDDGAIYEARETELKTSESCVEITKDEYNAAIEEVNERILSEISQTASSEQSKDEYIAELEAENAALLFQVLTGEELTDV